MLRHLWILDIIGGRLTVKNAFGAPGDTLLAANCCRTLKGTYPRLRINLETEWSELVSTDPCLETINAKEGYFTLRFWYLETATGSRGEANILQETLQKVGIRNYAYQSKVYLGEGELDEARALLGRGGRLRVAFSTRTKEEVKNWPRERWSVLLARFASEVELVQLGDASEPVFENVTRFAGALSMRQSMAVLANCDLFLGGVSFLMHAANGVNVPGVIIYGGRESPKNSGYAVNDNLYVPMPCGPCWLHDSRGDVCPHNIACMEKVLVDEVEGVLRSRLKDCRGEAAAVPNFS
ncbi:glycosyltransferase family 9 protein [Roseimicrobium sp. ORNL1]|uniref:glycosyltransferase family 9 protein n=1 Tax=Roseimicrobium sp. ORNL1 TaxID=2711231 RepID=UPI0013E1B365|nr:glycosyltransferase family 9 protein [Roseimicrobium sp. ORNL1]QIF02948.1 glycosyltransferase family 9 protein [Roseimicrobium sp. ORNL1]